MPKVTYQTLPTASAAMPPAAAEMFDRLKADVSAFINKVGADAASNQQELNAIIEEAYLRALLVAGVLMPLPEHSPLVMDTSNQVH